MKKWLKIFLIILWIFIIVWWVRAALTWYNVIPNWFWIEILCSQSSQSSQKVENSVNEYLCKKYHDKELCSPSIYTCVKTAAYNYECCIDGEMCKMYLEYPDGIDKPIIYLYPTEKENISVILWNTENLLHTYPKYDSNKWWNVIAQPNWELKDLDSGRKLYALYREWESETETNFDEGFVVAWKDIIPFLEEKLEILWLNEREVEEFIVYWLPQMEWNEWNLIRFETIEEQNMNMPLIITPKPNTIIRVMMDWNAIDKPIEIPEQELITPERIWFTVVERWGSKRK